MKGNLFLSFQHDRQPFMQSGIAVLLVLLFTFSSSVFVHARNMPDELYEGMIQFELDSGRYFDALVLMDEGYRKSHLINYLTALQGFNIQQSVPDLINKAKAQKGLKDNDYYLLGRTEYLRDDCMAALRLFKNIQGNLPLESKETLTFYRANCFIKLGSSARAGQALGGMVNGLWASYAYYNLAISYAEASRDKTKALVALRIAESLNPGKTREEKSLNDRVNLVAGKLYLESDNKDSAIQFFKKVYLQSESTPAALYLIGVTHLETGDFRAATQAWNSLKSYPLINQNVSEALLAVPFAFERSGYISQAIESYLEASNTFESELEKIKKIDELVVKHGAVDIFIDDSEIEGLEWFLAKDVVKNTTRAAYYQYLMQDHQFYDQAQLYAELAALNLSMNVWSDQLAVFESSIRAKTKSFKTKQSSFNPSSVVSAINIQKNNIDQLVMQPGMSASMANNLQVEEMKNSIEVLKIRLDRMQQKVAKGETTLNQQLAEVDVLKKAVLATQKRLSELQRSLGKEITDSARGRLAKLRTTMISNFERAEQGLIHLFEEMAESKQIKKRNLLDGRYQ